MDNELVAVLLIVVMIAFIAAGVVGIMIATLI
jgi:hypothetical protein